MEIRRQKAKKAEVKRRGKSKKQKKHEQKDEENMLTAESKQPIILQGSGNLLKEAEAILLGDMDTISVTHDSLEVARQC